MIAPQNLVTLVIGFNCWGTNKGILIRDEALLCFLRIFKNIHLDLMQFLRTVTVGALLVKL